jgi:hypothetical protein
MGDVPQLPVSTDEWKRILTSFTEQMETCVTLEQWEDAHRSAIRIMRYVLKEEPLEMSDRMKQSLEDIVTERGTAYYIRILKNRIKNTIAQFALSARHIGYFREVDKYMLQILYIMQLPRVPSLNEPRNMVSLDVSCFF